MQNTQFWPLVEMTELQEKKFDAAFSTAVDKAGSLSRLSTVLSSYASKYISHQALRTWRDKRNIPVAWALIFENYTNGRANFFDFCPWLRDRFKQEAS